MPLVVLMDEGCHGVHQFGITIRVIAGRGIDDIIVEKLDRTTSVSMYNMKLWPYNCHYVNVYADEMGDRPSWYLKFACASG
jgi:hypothetical protein